MTDMTNYIQAHWVAWLFTILSLLMGVLYRKLDHMTKSLVHRNSAIDEGVQAILRSEIIDKYNYYKDKGYCPIYAKENAKRLYKPYQNLGGNGVVEKLVDELLAMPTEKEGNK